MNRGAIQWSESPATGIEAEAAFELARENAHLRAEIRSLESRLGSAASDRVEAVDRERRRIERNLHDGAQQQFIAVAMKIASVKSKIGRDSDRAIALADEAVEDVKSAVKDLRRLATELHPPGIEEHGLRSAVEAMCDRSTVPVELSGVPADRFAPAVERTVYFVVSESLANIAKHARASQASIEFVVRAGSMIVEIRDDGIGGADIGKGSGLRGLVERAEEVGGTLGVTSLLRGGTLVRLVVPAATR